MADETSGTDQDADKRSATKLLAAYEEVCRSYHAIDDFRGKLLALLPIASGTAGILLLANEAFVESPHLISIGLFGVLVTLGLFSFEFRGLENCGRLLDVGLDLERKLKLENGQFLGDLEGNVSGHKGKKSVRLLISNARTAAYTIYGAVLLGWIYVAYLGFVVLFPGHVDAHS